MTASCRFVATMLIVALTMCSTNERKEDGIEWQGKSIFRTKTAFTFTSELNGQPFGPSIFTEGQAKRPGQNPCKNIFCNEPTHCHPWHTGQPAMSAEPVSERLQPFGIASAGNSESQPQYHAPQTLARPFQQFQMAFGLQPKATPTFTRAERDDVIDEHPYERQRKRPISSSSSTDSSSSDSNEHERKKAADVRAFGAPLEPMIRKGLDEDSRKRLRTCSRAVEKEFKINTTLRRLKTMIAEVQAMRKADGMEPFMPAIDISTIMGSTDDLECSSSISD